MTKGNTMLENSIIFDKGLSLEAIGLYAILKHYSSIPNFTIRREHIKSVSKYGETAFRRVWKELKEADLLVEIKYRVKGTFRYVFQLAENMKKEEKSNNKPSVDSNGCLPLENQLHYEELEKASEVENNNVAKVLEKYPTMKLSEKQKEILKEVNKEVLEVALNNIFVESVNFNYLMGAIERTEKNKNKVLPFTKEKTTKFVESCPPRENLEEYLLSIEEQLLGWA